MKTANWLNLAIHIGKGAESILIKTVDFFRKIHSSYT